METLVKTLEALKRQPYGVAAGICRNYGLIHNCLLTYRETLMLLGPNFIII